MKIDLETEQARQVALAYIRENHDNEEAMKEIVLAVFSGSHFVPWRWDTMLKHVVVFCSKAYRVQMNTLLEGWKQ